MPCSPLELNLCFGGIVRLNLQDLMSPKEINDLVDVSNHISCLAFISPMKMKVTPTSEKSVDFLRVTPLYMTELFLTTAVRSPNATSLLQSSHLKLCVIAAEPSSGVCP